MATPAYNILETLNANQQLDMLNVLCPKYGLDPQAVVQGLNPPDRASSTATSCTRWKNPASGLASSPSAPESKYRSIAR